MICSRFFDRLLPIHRTLRVAKGVMGVPQRRLVRLQGLGIVVLQLFLATTTHAAAQLSAPDAEKYLVQSARQNPNDFVAQQRLGEFYLQQNRLIDGIRYLEQAERINPGDYNTGYDLSLAYLDSGNLKKATLQLQTAIKRNETAELDGLLAETFEKSGDYKDAAIAYDRAASLDSSEDNIFNLGSFLLQHPHYEGFLDKALTVFQYGMQRYPQSEKLTVGVGVTLYALEKYDDAVLVLCSAVDLDPKNTKPYEFLGKLGHVSPALVPAIRERLKGFAQMYPDNEAANYYYAMSLLQESGDEKPADTTVEALLQKAVAADPQMYEAHFELGVLYQDQGKFSAAIDEFNQTLKLRPDYNRAHYRLVLLYSRTGQKDLAAQHLAILKQIKKEDSDADELGGKDEGTPQTTLSQKVN